MFHQDFQHSKTIKALGLRPRAFISFLVFGDPDETLALVYEIFLQKQFQIFKSPLERYNLVIFTLEKFDS